MRQWPPGPSRCRCSTTPTSRPRTSRDIIAYLHDVDKNENPGGLNLGNLGPVSEGLFAWTFGIGLLIACAVWLGKKAA